MPQSQQERRGTIPHTPRYIPAIHRILTILLALFLLIGITGCTTLPELTGLRPAREIAGPEAEYREIDGIALHVSDFGSTPPNASSTSLVLLHGFLSNIHTWDYLAPHLVDHYSLFGYDRIAFGLSDRPLPPYPQGKDPYATKAVRDRAAALITEELSGEKTVLVGNSAGGNLAVQLALTYPERYAALILIDPAIYQNGPPGFVRFLLKTGLFDRFGLKTVRDLAEQPDSLFDQAWADPSRIPPELIRAYREPLQAENWDKALFAYTKANSDPGIVRRLKEISIPVLIIHGTEDTIVPPDQSIRLAKEIPGARLELFPDCGHVPQEECPEITAKLIRDFLQEIGL